MKRLTLHVEISFGDDEPEQRDSQLDALVEHGPDYARDPEMHIGFRDDRLEDD